jgi:type IV pilus assembly protein PilB
MTEAAAKEHLDPSKRSSLKATIKDQPGAGKTRIGELLCKQGQITSSQLQEALDYQKRHQGRLGSILLKLGYIEEETIVNVLSRLHNYPGIVVSKMSPDPAALKILPYDVAKKYMAFPLRLKEENLEVTMAEPTDTSAVEALQNEVKKGLVVCVSTERDIIEAYRKHYNISDEEYKSFSDAPEEKEEDDLPVTQVEDFGSLVSEAVGEMELASSQADEGALDEYSASDAPIIKLVNGVLVKAVNDGVSDIHVEPFEKSLQVNYQQHHILCLPQIFLPFSKYIFQITMNCS